MKIKKRKKKNVWEEVSETIEAFRNFIQNYAPDPGVTCSNIYYYKGWWYCWNFILDMMEKKYPLTNI